MKRLLLLETHILQKNVTRTLNLKPRVMIRAAFSFGRHFTMIVIAPQTLAQKELQHMITTYILPIASPLSVSSANGPIQSVQQLAEADMSHQLERLLHPLLMVDCHAPTLWKLSCAMNTNAPCLLVASNTHHRVWTPLSRFSVLFEGASVLLLKN